MADFKVTIENFAEVVAVAAQIEGLDAKVDKLLSDLKLVELENPSNNSVLNGGPGEAYAEKYEELRKEIQGLADVVHHRGALLKQAMGIYQAADGSAKVDIDGVTMTVSEVNKAAADSRWMEQQ